MEACDLQNYCAKSTTPGIEWRWGHTTKEKAFERAQWFCDEWKKNGVDATARVFYRDGSPVADFRAGAVVKWTQQIVDPPAMENSRRTKALNALTSPYKTSKPAHSHS